MPKPKEEKPIQEEIKAEATPEVKVASAPVPDPKIAELELKVHALEVEKRVTKIHSKWPEFDNKTMDLKELDAVQYALDNFKPKVETHAIAVAEVTPKDNIRVARKPLEPIDEDAVVSKAVNL